MGGLVLLKVFSGFYRVLLFFCGFFGGVRRTKEGGRGEELRGKGFN